MPVPLVEGLYERLITEGVSEGLKSLGEGRRAEVGKVEHAEAARRFAQHLASEIERALSAVAEKDRPRLQIEIANRLLDSLGELTPDGGFRRAHINEEGEELRAVYRAAPPPRPSTPMSASTLLTRGRSEPNLGVELAHEVASADRVDVLVAFITMSGVRALRAELEAFARREGSQLRVLTTVFSGITEPQAVEFLANLPGAEVKISYDVRRTRLHAKAWLFQRNSELHTAYVGSANLTSTALGSGQEWMVKVCAADLPNVVAKFRGTFESLWNDPEFEHFEAHDVAARERLAAALGKQQRDEAEVTAFFTLKPFPFQQEILDRLEAQRIAHGRTRNLVVAATGTGKTVVAAFDYRREANREGLAPRLLFLAHREELLTQARGVFRNVLRDHSFGELLVGGREPERWEHVFATIQSATRREVLKRLGPEHFRYVVLDECHHAPADSYQALVPHLRPAILLGLTATPERSDGKSLLDDFDGHIAAELRIWDALDRQLLVPFEYYGIADSVDLDQVRWTRTGYEQKELERIYTGNEKRVDLIVKQLANRVSSLKQVRALAFCVSVAHAEYMARAFTERGLPALAIHGGSPSDDRNAGPRKLRQRDCNVLCVCDLYNEGIDLPFVDTLLFLRPTQSVTLFLQQLGRGLRLPEEEGTKPTCLVLDFIGRQRAEFRFDGIFSALSGVPRARVSKAVEEGFPYLPSGCMLQLDTVSREHVLASLREHVGRRSQLAKELRDLRDRSGKTPSLAEFLGGAGRELEDVYSGSAGWTGLRRQAGVLIGEDDDADDLSKRFVRLLHADDRARLDVMRQAAQGDGKANTDADRRHFAMLSVQLEHRGILKTAEETAKYVTRSGAVQSELRELADVLEERIVVANPKKPVAEWSLLLHCHYGRREIMAGIGRSKAGDKIGNPQVGILKLKAQKRELLFITLNKSHHSFSPTTRYRDYAISRDLFHWETQSIASVEQESGRRYTESPANGWTFHLFVRASRDTTYAYLGPARRESHEGDRPIAITWRLQHSLSETLFARFATLAQG